MRMGGCRGGGGRSLATLRCCPVTGFSLLCYTTCATAARADLISVTPHARHLVPASSLLPLAWEAVISSQSPPFDMLHAQGGASLR